MVQLTKEYGFIYFESNLLWLKKYPTLTFILYPHLFILLRVTKDWCSVQSRSSSLVFKILSLCRIILLQENKHSHFFRQSQLKSLLFVDDSANSAWDVTSCRHHIFIPSYMITIVCAEDLFCILYFTLVEASMILLHRSRSRASMAACSRLCPLFSRSLRSTSFQLFLGLPTGLLPCISAFIILSLISHLTSSQHTQTTSF